MLSFVLAGVGCAFAGLCYAEFASMIPIAGSAYTYAYATLGEIFAWIIGWDLILEYAFGAATVASGWSVYPGRLPQDFGIRHSAADLRCPGREMVDGRRPLGARFDLQRRHRWRRATQHTTTVFNLMAFLAIIAVTTLLVSASRNRRTSTPSSSS